MAASLRTRPTECSVVPRAGNAVKSQSMKAWGTEFSGLNVKISRRFGSAAVAFRHEAGCAEGVLFQHLIDHEVIVIQLEAGERGEFASDRVFAGGSGAV